VEFDFVEFEVAADDRSTHHICYTSTIDAGTNNTSYYPHHIFYHVCYYYAHTD